MKLIVIVSMLFANMLTHAQVFNTSRQQQDSSYQQLKDRIILQFKTTPAGQFNAFVKGVDEDVLTDKKVLALTFDACGGPHGSGYDADLITLLRREKIPATLFLTGLWIDANPAIAKDLAADPLFEIENHGLTHHPCAIAGESKYGIQGTKSVGQAVDEIELNARKIERITSRKPLYYRSATATTDEACTEIARQLGETIISYDLLSGDAVAGTPLAVIKENLVRGAKHGAIVIMHMNHPEWNGSEALQAALPEWRQQGFSFIRLEHHPLKGRK